MQRTSLFISAMIMLLYFSNCHLVFAEASEMDDCWVIVKENYEWIHEDEEMVANHSRESNLSYDSQCRLIERTDTSSDMLEHKFISYNEDSTISNTSLYWYGSDGDIIYLWEETFAYQDGVLTADTWTEFSNYDGNLSSNQQQHTVYSYDSQGREILTNTSHGSSSYTVETSYDDNGNVAKVDSSRDGDLYNSIEYEYDSANVLITETSTDYWTNAQVSKTTNYSYDGSGKLVSKEQHDAGNNWTLYWNYTYDERVNKITEEFTRTGNSPWATITTYAWDYGIESPGADEADGADAQDGQSGEEGVNDIDGQEGQPGEDGVNGTDGQDGQPSENGVDDTEGQDGDTATQTDLDTSDSNDESSSNMWGIILLIVLFTVITPLVFSRGKGNVIGTLVDKIIKDKFEEE